MSNPAAQDARSQLQELKRQIVAQISAEERIYRRYTEADREADRWRSRARLALERDNEELARAALARSARHEGEAAEFRRQYLEQKGHVERMKVLLLQAESRPATSSPSPRPAAPLDLARLERNLLELERQRERAREQQARTAAWAELERDELSEKLDALERTDRLERQLAEMKQRLGRQ